MTAAESRIVAVTGAAGLLGRHVLAAFRDGGWDARGLDRAEAAGVGTIDLRDPEAARRAMRGAAVIAHCAALPRPTGFAPDDVFATNMALTHAAVSAAEAEGARLLYASSYSVCGLPFAPRPVHLTALPLTDAEPPAPQDVYATTKALGEAMLDAFARRTGGRAASLRLPWIHTAETFRRDVVPIRDDPDARRHLWAWIDGRDAARLFVLAAEAPLEGHERFLASAAETFALRPSALLAAEGWPDTPLGRPLRDHESLIDGARARERLGFEPQHRWQGYEGTGP